MLTLIKKLAGAVPTPATNKRSVFIDDATGLLSVKDDTGNVMSLSNDYSSLENLPISGTVVLVAGTATVAEASIASSSKIFLTSQVDGGTPGWLRVSARTDGVDFTVTSSDSSDTSTVAYLIIP